MHSCWLVRWLIHRTPKEKRVTSSGHEGSQDGINAIHQTFLESFAKRLKEDEAERGYDEDEDEELEEEGE